MTKHFVAEVVNQLYSKTNNESTLESKNKAQSFSAFNEELFTNTLGALSNINWSDNTEIPEDQRKNQRAKKLHTSTTCKESIISRSTNH
jgi:hypothetical protein